MNWIAAGFAALLAGVLSGWLASSGLIAPASVSDASTTHDDAVTFLGTAERKIAASDLLSQIPGNGNRTREDYLALLEQANRQHDAALRRAVLAEWTTHENADGIRAVFALGNRLEGWQVLQDWTPQHPGLAAGIVATLDVPKGEERHRDTVVTTAIQSLLHTDPDKASEIERRFRLSEWSLLPMVIDSLRSPGDASPQAILKALGGFRNHRLRDQLLASLVYSDQIPPQDAIEWSVEHTSPPANSQLFTNAISVWMQRDPAAAREHFSKALDGGRESRDLVRPFLLHLANRSPEEMLSWMRQQDREKLAAVAPFDWSRISKEAHPGFAAALGSDYPEFAPLVEPASSLPRADAKNLPASWPPQTPDEAFAWLKISPNRPELGAQHWTPETLDATLALLPYHSDLERTEITRTLANIWARKDPVKAITWASGLRAEESIIVAESALDVWHNYDPPAARNYVETMPSGEFRAYAVETVVEDWIRQNPDSTTAWLDSLGPGFETDVGRRVAAGHLSSQAPEAAYHQARAISHPVMRDEWVQKSLRSLLRHPDRVIALLPESGLPPDLQEKIEKEAHAALVQRP
jgi:hypothetical protein